MPGFYEGSHVCGEAPSMAIMESSDPGFEALVALALYSLNVHHEAVARIEPMLFGVKPCR